MRSGVARALQNTRKGISPYAYQSANKNLDFKLNSSLRFAARKYYTLGRLAAMPNPR